MITNFPGTDEAKAASAFIANMDHLSGADAVKAPAKPPGPTYATEDGEHFVILLAADSAGRMPRVRAAISNFDLSYFRGTPLQVMANIYNDSLQAITIRSFPNKQKAMEYYGLFKGNKTDLKGIADRGWPLFAISAANYAKFYMAKDASGYMDFFTKNYLGGK